MLLITTYLWAISFFCSIAAAITGSAPNLNTTITGTSHHGSVSRTLSSSLAISSIRSSASSRTVSSSSLPVFSGSSAKTSSIRSLSQVISKGNSATVSGSSVSQLTFTTRPQSRISSVSTSISQTLSKSQSAISSSSATTSQLSTQSKSAVKSSSASTSKSVSSQSSSSSKSYTSIGPSLTTLVTSGTTEVVTSQPSSITSAPIIAIQWSTVTPTTTSGVSTATHDSHGWPIIPVINCWFCPPIGGGGGGIGFLLPDITGPGILPPPGPGDAPPGFSSNMPSITLNSAGDPSYDSKEPTSQPTNSASSTKSTSSSSSCTSTTTGYDLYVTCTSSTSTGLLTSSGSKSCVTSTVTTTGCDLKTTASTTTVSACPLSAMSSISSAYLIARAAGGTVVSGKTYPLALWPTAVSVSGSASPSVSAFGVSSDTSSSFSASASTIKAASTSSIPKPSPRTSSTAFPPTTITPTPSASSLASKTAPPICSEANNSLMGMNNVPASWCFCEGRGPFSTIPSKTTSYCAFSAWPTQTISLTSISTSVATSCIITSSTYSLSGAPASTSATYCQCGEIIAGIGTTTSGNVVLAGCEITKPWPIVSTVSTIPPPTSTTSKKLAYHTGICDLHVFEGSQSYQDNLYVQLNITDGAGDLLTSRDYKLNWGDTATVPSSDSKLPYDIKVDFLESTSSSRNQLVRKMVGPPVDPTVVDWEDWILSVTAGSTSWTDKDTDSSSLPYCSVGGWDNGNFWSWLDDVLTLGGDEYLPNRQMDCHWKC